MIGFILMLVVLGGIAWALLAAFQKEEPIEEYNREDMMIPAFVINSIKSHVNAIEIFEGGSYMCGHPKINNPTDIYLAVTDESFALFQPPGPGAVTEVKLLGEILKKAIKQITIEDKTTIEKKVTAGRVLALGVFALAFKKKTANEMGFVVVEWTDARNMEHKTTFKIEGELAMGAANTLRNSLLKHL